MAQNSWREYASEVDKARRREHLSIRQFALAAEVPKATAQGWLNGRHMPTPALRRKFLRAVVGLGLDTTRLEAWWQESGGADPA